MLHGIFFECLVAAGMAWFWPPSITRQPIPIRGRISTRR
jgi:hypothetical protein